MSVMSARVPDLGYGGRTAKVCLTTASCFYFIFNIFDHDLDDGTEHTINQFSDDMRLGGEADTSEGCGAIQRHVNSLMK